jgi:hypothetical protein
VTTLRTLFFFIHFSLRWAWGSVERYRKRFNEPAPSMN